MADKKGTRPLRLGLVGGGLQGYIGAAHLICARQHGLFQLCAGALSSRASVAHASAAAYGIAPERSYASYAEMAQEEAARADGIEVVAITTPNDLHAAPALAFAAAGIDVICEKPLTESLASSLALQKEMAAHDVVFVLTHNYTGYPLVRQARAMVGAGRLGRLLQARVNYLQDGVLLRAQDGGAAADWHGKPARCGPAGTLADIGSHAYHMLRFVTGADAVAVAAISAIHTAPARELDDHAEVLLRLQGGALGSLSCSQVATGTKCELGFALYGDKASLQWSQEQPNELVYCELGAPKQIMQRGTAYLAKEATPESNIAPGHTEGYYEAFAQLYRDAHDLIRARRAGAAPPPLAAAHAPNLADGVAVARFVASCVESARRDSAWVELAGVTA